MKYYAEVELGQTPAQCAYNAIVPQLPGCFTTGESLEELKAHLFEAAQGWIEVSREQGRDYPMPTGFLLLFRPVEVVAPV
jgi:predicted RNase H-like HicB family nuclease